MNQSDSLRGGRTEALVSIQTGDITRVGGNFDLGLYYSTVLYTTWITTYTGFGALYRIRQPARDNKESYCIVVFGRTPVCRRFWNGRIRQGCERS